LFKKLLALFKNSDFVFLSEKNCPSANHLTRARLVLDYKS